MKVAFNAVYPGNAAKTEIRIVLLVNQAPKAGWFGVVMWCNENLPFLEGTDATTPLGAYEKLLHASAKMLEKMVEHQDLWCVEDTGGLEDLGEGAYYDRRPNDTPMYERVIW